MPPTIAKKSSRTAGMMPLRPTRRTADSLVGAAGGCPAFLTDRTTTRPWTRKIRTAFLHGRTGTRDSGRGNALWRVPADRRLREKPTFARPPDNTGLVGILLHVETDIYKQYLTFYTVSWLSDRNNGWITLSECGCEPRVVIDQFQLAPTQYRERDARSTAADSNKRMRMR